MNHLDWSTDSRVLQSNDQSYELLYWQADRLSPGLGMQLLHDQRDTQWETWSTINGAAARTLAILLTQTQTQTQTQTPTLTPTLTLT